MTYTTAKERLHDYIEHAHQDKIMAIYTLLEEEIEHKNVDYDEKSLEMLEKLSDDAFSGRSKTFTAEESIENIRQHRGGK
jgi:hypothetical protein